MILITCGTNEQPFDRLVAAAHGLGREEQLFVQYGSSRITRGFGEWVDFVSFDDLADRMREARVVISHAGVGSIILARRCGKVPIIVPRRLYLDEAVDDHQLLLARRLHERGLARLVENAADLLRTTRSPNGTPSLGTADELPGKEALTTDLREALDAAVLRRPRMNRVRQLQRFADRRVDFCLRLAATADTRREQAPETPASSAPASGGRDDERSPRSMSVGG